MRPSTLDRSPKKNAIEKAGGLPPYIEEIATALHRDGMTISHAIAVAINAVERMCVTGDLNYHGDQQVSPAHRAKACAAAAEWQALKVRMRANSIR